MNQKKKGRFTSDSTVATRLPDPGLSKLAPFPSKKLTSIQKGLASCTVIRNDMDKNEFSLLINNLAGAHPISLQGKTLIALRSRKSLFIMTSVAPESLYDNAPGLMDVNLRRRCTLRREDGKCMYVCMITSKEFRQIQRVAAQEQMASQDVETIVPGPDGVVGFADFQRKLAVCDVVISPDPDFDVKRFAAQLKFVSLFRDKEDNQYYLLMSGNEEIPYRMYVNQENLSTLDSVVLTYNEDACIIVPDE